MGGAENPKDFGTIINNGGNDIATRYPTNGRRALSTLLSTKSVPSATLSRGRHNGYRALRWHATGGPDARFFYKAGTVRRNSLAISRVRFNCPLANGARVRFVAAAVRVPVCLGGKRSVHFGTLVSRVTGVYPRRANRSKSNRLERTHLAPRRTPSVQPTTFPFGRRYRRYRDVLINSRGTRNVFFFSFAYLRV